MESRMTMGRRRGRSEIEIERGSVRGNMWCDVREESLNNTRKGEGNVSAASSCPREWTRQLSYYREYRE